MMSVTPTPFNSETHIRHSTPNRKNHNLPRDDHPQLHKRRKGPNGISHQQELRPPISPQDQFLPPHLHFQIPPVNPYLNFGRPLISPTAFSSPAINNSPKLVNENMFNGFPHQQFPLEINLLDPLVFQHSNLQQIQNRQAVLEQLKVQEHQQHQQLLKPFAKSKSQDGMSSPVQPPDSRRSSHNDLVVQHMEEYKMKQMQKDAVRQANTRFGNFIPQESSHFNFIVPALPVSLLDVKREE